MTIRLNNRTILFTQSSIYGENRPLLANCSLLFHNNLNRPSPRKIDPIPDNLKTITSPTSILKPYAIPDRENLRLREKIKTNSGIHKNYQSCCNMNTIMTDLSDRDSNIVNASLTEAQRKSKTGRSKRANQNIAKKTVNIGILNSFDTKTRSKSTASTEVSKRPKNTEEHRALKKIIREKQMMLQQLNLKLKSNQELTSKFENLIREQKEEYVFVDKTLRKEKQKLQELKKNLEQTEKAYQVKSQKLRKTGDDIKSLVRTLELKMKIIEQQKQELDLRQNALHYKQLEIKRREEAVSSAQTYMKQYDRELVQTFDRLQAKSHQIEAAMQQLMSVKQRNFIDEIRVAEKQKVLEKISTHLNSTVTELRMETSELHSLREQLSKRCLQLQKVQIRLFHRLTRSWQNSCEEEPTESQFSVKEIGLQQQTKGYKSRLDFQKGGFLQSLGEKGLELGRRQKLESSQESFLLNFQTANSH